LPSDAKPWQGQPHSILITVPPLAVLYFKPGEEPGLARDLPHRR
jgi:hypothetical protein